MKVSVKANASFAGINEYTVRDAQIGYYGYITKGLQNLQAIMPVHYKPLTFKSVVGNHFVRKTIKTEFPALSIANNEYDNFYHFMYESLVKLYCLRDHINSSAVVFPGKKYKYHDEWFEILGIKNLLFITVRELIKTPLAISCNFPEDEMACKKDILVAFKDWVLKNLTDRGMLYSKNRFPDKVFISRTRAKYRKVVNFDEVVPVLQEFGYTIIDLEDYSLAEQINYFYHARDIVGVHGAGFAHMCFTKAPVLDIIVDNFYIEFFYKLSQTYDLRYDYLRSKEWITIILEDTWLS
ncbi:MAG: glycosyltransferase family 61 protein [Chitinophagaceae bacterium]|nr:glycosyltransferase family 61 protein [Chitinophagaceae bacterium]